MPTGYTAPIDKGITFRNYALNCAKAFGALIEMRDEPMDKEIPEKFEPTSYHTDKIVELEKELAEIRNINDEEAGKRARAEYDEDLKRHEGYIRDKAILKEKYLAMLAQVRAWKEPTPEHREYKNFMEKQITDSIDWDCSTSYYTPPILREGRVWLSDKLAKLMKDLTYHKDENMKEIERVNGRNEWINALRNSLPSAQRCD